MELYRKLRQQLQLTQGQMAERLGLSRQFWGQLETGKALLGRERARELEPVLGPLPTMADTLSNQEQRGWSPLYPYELACVSGEPWRRALRNWGYPISQLGLDARTQAWMVQLLPCDSAVEAYGWLQLAALEARPLLHNPHQLGFRDQPIVDGQGKALGERYLPGLYGGHGEVKFMVWPQVRLRPGNTTFRVDGLVSLKVSGVVFWAILEFDGRGHNYEGDDVRRELLRMREIRISQDQVERRQVGCSFCAQARAHVSPC